MMGWKTEIQQRIREIDEQRFVVTEGNKKMINEFADRSITPEEQAGMRMNSYAQDALPPKLTDAALIQTIETFAEELPIPPVTCTTYSEILLYRHLPELLKRLKEYQK